MSFRRLVALLALAFAAWLWRAATHEFSGTFLAALSLLLAPLIGLLALAVLVFNLRTFGLAREDSGFGVLTPRQGTRFGAAILFLFGVLLIVIALRGVHAGAMPAFGDAPDIAFRQAPLRYLLTLGGWIAAGAALIWLARQLWRRPEAGHDSASDRG